MSDDIIEYKDQQENCSFDLMSATITKKILEKTVINRGVYRIQSDYRVRYKQMKINRINLYLYKIFERELF